MKDRLSILRLLERSSKEEWRCSIRTRSLRNITNMFDIVPGMAYMIYDKWVTTFYAELIDGRRQFTRRGSSAFEIFSETIVRAGECPNFRNPQSEVMQSLNKLMFVTGIQAVKQLSDFEVESRIDSGWPIHTTPVGSLVGHHSVSTWACRLSS